MLILVCMGKNFYVTEKTLLPIKIISYNNTHNMRLRNDDFILLTAFFVFSPKASN